MHVVVRKGAGLRAHPHEEGGRFCSRPILTVVESGKPGNQGPRQGRSGQSGGGGGGEEVGCPVHDKI